MHIWKTCYWTCEQHNMLTCGHAQIHMRTHMKHTCLFSNLRRLCSRTTCQRQPALCMVCRGVRAGCRRALVGLRLTLPLLQITCAFAQLTHAWYKLGDNVYTKDMHVFTVWCCIVVLWTCCVCYKRACMLNMLRECYVVSCDMKFKMLHGGATAQRFYSKFPIYR